MDYRFLLIPRKSFVSIIKKKKKKIIFHLQQKASAPEELSLQDGEDIDFLENHGDGWCKARNKSGKVGFVPESYIEIKPRAASIADNNEVRSNKSSASSPANSTVSDAWQVSILPGDSSPAAVPAAATTYIPTPVVEVEPAPNYGMYFFSQAKPKILYMTKLRVNY